ncbi:MAG TPA: amino acid permease [Gemmatimonadota bacterium]|nr:amino acid permease [Gemmatimonadota bacterium]
MPSLLRAVSRWQVLGIAINDVVGSGVYLLPAATAALMGGASLWAILAAGLAVSLLVLCFAEAASHFDEPGSGYLYTREAFGPFVGFEVGWMTWITRIATSASLANGFAQALGFLWPGASVGAGRVLVMGGALALFTWINVVGVRSGARAAAGLAVAKSLPLLLLVAVGILSIDIGSVVAAAPFSTRGLSQAALLLLFAYAGFENSAAVAGECRNPRRDIPRALITMIASVTTLYFLIQLVALGTLPDLGARSGGAPLAEAAARLMGGWGGILLTAGAAVSILGTIGGSTLNGPRYLFAMADDGFGPRVFARVHPRWRTPYVAIPAQTLLAFVLALSGSFVQLALLSVVARLAMYIGTAAAVPVLRGKFPRTEETIVLPGGPTIPIAALLLCLVFLAGAEPRNLVMGAIALAVGAVIYALRRRPSPSASVGAEASHG